MTQGVEMQRGEAQRRNLHGRRVGRPLRGAQADLLEEWMPQLRLDLSASPSRLKTTLFEQPVTDIWLEIGFGAGEHLLWQAEQNPQIGLIGCEPFVNGVVKVVRHIRDDRLGNIRLHDDDARHVLDWLPEASLARVFVLFPDPWPKKRHRKRRLLSDEGLTLIARAIRPGGELRFATDIADYAEMVCEAIDRSDLLVADPGLLAERPDDWPLTRYAEKGVVAGRKCQFFSFHRKEITSVNVQNQR